MPGSLDPCAWASSTSAPTPGICSWSTPTAAPRPLPAFSYKEPLRLAEHLDESGAVSQTGIDALTAFTAEALVVAEDKGCEDI